MTLNEANEILSKIKVPYYLCGAFARGLKESKDIDLVVDAKYRNLLLNQLRQNFNVKLKTNGAKQISLTADGKQIDIWFFRKPEELGILLTFCYGNNLFNIAMRTYLRHKGIKLAQDHLVYKNKKYYFKTEQDFFNFLNIRYIPLSERNVRTIQEGINLLRKNKLSDEIPNPNLV